MEKKKAKRITIYNINHVRSGFNKGKIITEELKEAALQYDDNGNLIREEHYTSENELDAVTVNQYNDLGLLVSSTQLNANDELCQKTEYAYNEEKKIIRENNFYGEGSPEYSSHFLYKDGLLMERSSYDDGVFSHVEKEYAYKDGLLTKEIDYDEDGKKLYIIENEYNEKGLLLKRVRTEVMEKDRRTYLFEYDDKGNKLKDLIYNYNEQLIAKNYYTYNENNKIIELENEDLDKYQKTKYTYEGNNLVKVENFDKKGNLLSWYENQYDEYNEVTETKHYRIDEVDESNYRIFSEARYIREY